MVFSLDKVEISRVQTGNRLRSRSGRGCIGSGRGSAGSTSGVKYVLLVFFHNEFGSRRCQ